MICTISDGMNSQPITAMARVAVPSAGGGQANQHTATNLVMTEVTGTMMDCGRGDDIPGMATLAGVVACRIDHTAVVDVGMALKVVGTMAGITIIKRIGLRHGLANGTADQRDRGGRRAMAGLAGVMAFRISSAGGKYR